MQQMLVSVTKAAEVLSLSRSTIYELMDAGELTKVKFGRRTGITVDSIKAAVKARTGEDVKHEVFAV
ncbi:helix-turn-helix transcriptional regulator [Novosphingobium pituita]|jgi:excisionase family DNA binding protein|uniref:Helix-turn-helix domain-containing protein n=1 Tax=Novosphingobium pituita TaxID=3056842 RepID=A0ABQ6PDG4_9SPHN|nr:helix-turn-helix domain-containing protein [Novosphingobium sp. IK01]GMM62306.1 hypothetical protein NUTIK01_30830 [Novosphingobium sp. IK01]